MKPRRIAAVLIGLVMAAAGCGGGGSASPSPSSASPAASSSSTPSVGGTGSASASPSASVSSSSAPLSDVRVSLTQVASLDAPLGMAIRTGDDGLYVAEKGGRIMAIRNGQVDDTPVLDI